MSKRVNNLTKFLSRKARLSALWFNYRMTDADYIKAVSLAGKKFNVSIMEGN